jgi:aspartyl-tRNA(Asn)/glutamyl-tRNA(Gln) amidotransferase subunit B
MKGAVVLKGMIGLEIHCYLKTKEKLFCSCIASRERGLEGNTYVCPVCTGQPGAKPLVPNEDAVRKGVQIGLVLRCTISSSMPWIRKHYAWPDLPKGYQTTLSGSGSVPLGIKGNFHGIGIREMHLEEDPASWEPGTGKVDYNRSGLPLVEIVTEPDFSTAEEVQAWLGKLVHHLSYLKAIDTNAGIKVDVNVNIPRKTKRVEIKNVNSIDEIGKAIVYELTRQAEEGGAQEETRRWDASKGKTMVMRSKEGGADYRFLSDPDLPSLRIAPSFVASLKNALPESPEVKVAKLVKQHRLSAGDARILASHIDLVSFFEEVAQHVEGKVAAPWVTGPLLRLLNDHATSLEHVEIVPAHFIALVQLVQQGVLTPLKAKEIIGTWYPKSSMPSATEGKLSDETHLKALIADVLRAHQKAVQDYKAGEQKALDFLLGAVMKASQKRADYAVARKLLLKALG